MKIEQYQRQKKNNNRSTWCVLPRQRAEEVQRQSKECPGRRSIWVKVQEAMDGWQNMQTRTYIGNVTTSPARYYHFVPIILDTLGMVSTNSSLFIEDILQQMEEATGNWHEGKFLRHRLSLIINIEYLLIRTSMLVFLLHRFNQMKEYSNQMTDSLYVHTKG